MKFASVILDIPTAALETPYTYAVPETTEEQAQVMAKKPSAKMPAKKAMQVSLDDLLAADSVQISPNDLLAVGFFRGKSSQFLRSFIGFICSGWLRGSGPFRGAQSRGFRGWFERGCSRRP